MKLKPGFETYMHGKTQVLVATGNDKFAGVVRSNPTAAFIVEQLKSETTEEAIIDTMMARYEDADRDLITRDVRKVVNTLRSIEAIDD